METKEQIEGDKNKEIEYTYDKQGNLVQVKSSLENEKAQYVQYVYDEQGNKVRQFTGMTGPLTVTVAAVENAKDDAGKDTFTYGGKTYAVLVTGKKKSDTIRETKYVYDTKNRLVSYTDPEGRTETYTYDCNSNLTKTVDKNGNTLKNTYDNKNRLTERTAKEKKTGKETVHTYSYNAYGDVAVQDDTQLVYGDVSGQVTKETTKLTKNKDVVKNYTYDSNGNKSTFSIKAGEDTKLSLSYEYDGSSRLISVKDSEGNRSVSYAYDTEGSLSERQAANGLKTTYGYDYQNRLTSMTNETGKGVVSKYSSTYFKNGQKAEEVSTVMDKKGKSTKKTAAYTYDMLGRITRETKTGREDISYTYDANNNRKQMTIGNKTTAYQYNKNDELLRTDTLHTDTEKNDVVIYKNDKNGNQLAAVNRSEIPAEAKDTSYIDVDVTLGDNQLNDNVVNHYNALNQLTETLTKNYKVSFTYDAEGLRTGKTVNGEKTVYVWDGDQVVMELSKGGAVQKRYIRGNDLVYADKGENTEKTYYVTDMHGNVVQLLDESGNVTKTYEYDSFGNEVKPEKKDENPYRYCGEYYDKETEEVYLRARYYEPSVGRFITRDTYTGESDEPLSLHLYTYCENDGVNMVDPSGHWGRRAGGSFVHQDITKLALKQYSGKYCLGGINVFIKLFGSVNYESIVEGAILPDFLSDVKKGEEFAKKKYGEDYYRKYRRKYKEKDLGKIYAKNKSKKTITDIKNTFHGKSMVKLKKLKKAVKNKIRKSYNVDAFTILGCVLHSIQDYQAHSFASDLETYKKIKDKTKFSQKINEFHKDWITGVGNDKLHHKTKDNPNAIFSYNRRRKKWEWRGKFDSKEVNERYKASIRESYKYLKNIFKSRY